MNIQPHLQLLIFITKGKTFEKFLLEKYCDKISEVVYPQPCVIIVKIVMQSVDYFQSNVYC